MSKTCTIVKAGRSDTYGRPLLVGQSYTGPDDEVFSLWQSGFASVAGAPNAFLPVSPVRQQIVATQKGVYIIMPSTLTFSGSAGDFTLSGAIFSGFAAAVGHGFWGYFPADSGDAGLAAGWYFCVAGTDTSGTRYKDQPATYGSAYPVTPTAFSTNLSGANAGTTSEITMFAATVPGGSMGPNGRIEVTYQFAGTSASDTKTFRVKLGASAEQVGIYQASNTTTNVLHRDLRIFNLGSEQRQWEPPGAATTTVSSISYSNIDMSVDQEISFTLQTSAAGSAVASLYCSALVIFSD